MTAREGLEPSLRGPEPRVLPLDDRALIHIRRPVVFLSISQLTLFVNSFSRIYCIGITGTEILEKV